MKNNTLLYIIIGFLVVMNGFFLFKHFGLLDVGGPQKPGLENFMTKQLEFDATQLQKFEELDRAHREKISTLRGDLKTLKEKLFEKISKESFEYAEIDAITSEIANLEKAKALETFEFFNSVSEICNENQRDRFKKIIQDGLERQGPPEGNRPPRGNRPPEGDRPPEGSRPPEGGRPSGEPGREHRPPPPPEN